jgi:hypothetical protein
VPGLFFVLFGAFLKGVLENRVFSGWFFAVSLWWIRGELWCGLAASSVVGKDMPTFLSYF